MRHGLVATGGALLRLPRRVPYRPTVVTGLQPTHALVRDKLAGPVTAVLRAEDEDEALCLANATEYGLAASIVTRGNGSRDTGPAALETYTEWKTTYLAAPGTALEPVDSEQLAP